VKKPTTYHQLPRFRRPLCRTRVALELWFTLGCIAAIGVCLWIAGNPT
jgi:hypothetical protein